MERLTERFENGQVGVAGCGKNCKYSYKYCENAEERCPVFNEIYEKLAAYEDAEELEEILRLPISEDTPVYSIEYCCGNNKSNRSGMCFRGFCENFTVQRIVRLSETYLTILIVWMTTMKPYRESEA